MKKEHRVRQKQREHKQWRENNYDDLLAWTLNRGVSKDIMDRAIKEVEEDDIREILTGKRSKEKWDK